MRKGMSFLTAALLATASTTALADSSTPGYVDGLSPGMSNQELVRTLEELGYVNVSVVDRGLAGDDDDGADVSSGESDGFVPDGKDLIGEDFGSEPDIPTDDSSFDGTVLSGWGAGDRMAYVNVLDDGEPRLLLINLNDGAILEGGRSEPGTGAGSTSAPTVGGGGSGVAAGGDDTGPGPGPGPGDGEPGPGEGDLGLGDGEPAPG